MLTREEVAQKHAQVVAIIAPTRQQPTIVNDASKFVVVTYWWGRDRLNFNTARPCGEFYESLLDKPTHLLTPAQATPQRFRAALLGNPKFTEFVAKKTRDYMGVLKAHRAEGKPLSSLYTEKTADQIQSLILEQTLAYVETVLPRIQAFQQLFVERADLEDTFQRRLAAGFTGKQQLETIRQRLAELKSQKEEVLREIKGGIGPFKSQLDKALRYADPITYDEMIAIWEATCRKAGCNYLAVEYPQFTEPGGYQLAINAKPRFIQKALELCGNRGVLYIDGDMTVNRYPTIFDMPDVDMMARGWNVDPRSSYRHNESILVDPYTFETSGGTMFFGQTPEAHLLLQRWIDVSEQFSQWGKADDRILSLVFNTYKLLLPLKIIQLPVEYLWLSLDYDDSIEPELQDRDAIYLEHPECLTSEETAAGQGASSSRTPKYYATIEDSYPRSEFLHEAVMFPDEASTAAFRPYLNYVGSAKYFEDVEDPSLVGVAPFQVIPFSEGLGPFQSTAEANAVAVRNMPPLSNNSNISPLSPLIVQEKEGIIPHILQALEGGKDVIYMPPTASDAYRYSLEVARNKFPRIEFMYVNASPDPRRIFYFNSLLNIDEPMLFRAGSRHLLQLLYMCRSLEDLQKQLTHNYQFLSRIRTHLLKRYRGQSGGNVGNIGYLEEDPSEFLYGSAPQKGGFSISYRRRASRRRTHKSRKSRRKTGNSRKRTYKK